MLRESWGRVMSLLGASNDGVSKKSGKGLRRRSYGRSCTTKKRGAGNLPALGFRVVRFPIVIFYSPIDSSSSRRPLGNAPSVQFVK
jgi:hypothetical protein